MAQDTTSMMSNPELRILTQRPDRCIYNPAARLALCPNRVGLKCAPSIPACICIVRSIDDLKQSLQDPRIGRGTGPQRIGHGTDNVGPTFIIRGNVYPLLLLEMLEHRVQHNIGHVVPGDHCTCGSHLHRRGRITSERIEKRIEYAQL